LYYFLMYRYGASEGTDDIRYTRTKVNVNYV
jgi:hypothetical protein